METTKGGHDGGFNSIIRPSGESWGISREVQLLLKRIAEPPAFRELAGEFVMIVAKPGNFISSGSWQRMSLCKKILVSGT